MIDIESATKEELLIEYEEMEKYYSSSKENYVTWWISIT